MASEIYSIILDDEKNDRLEKVARACGYTNLSDCVFDLFFLALKEQEVRIYADAYRQLQSEVSELFDRASKRNGRKHPPKGGYDDDIPF